MEQIIQTLIDWGMAVLGFLGSVPPEVYAYLGGTLFFSLALESITVFVKRKWDNVPSKTKMSLINIGGILITAFGTYLTMTPEMDPATAILTLTGLGFLAQQPIYFRFIKPFVNDAYANWDKGRQLNDNLSSAAIPEDGLPLER